MVIEVKGQERKAQLPIFVTEYGMVTEVSLEQLPKAFSPISVTEDGMVASVREEQCSKAQRPILVNGDSVIARDRIETYLREVQSLKAPSPISVTEKDGIVTDSSEKDGIVTDSSEVQPRKTCLLILLTDDGMVTSVREEQLSKAWSSISKTSPLEGQRIVTDVREVQE